MFADLIGQVTKVIQHYEEREELPSEEATRHALVLPFIRDVLGADYLNPKEVIPKFTTDIDEHKGEKVDYAICRDGEPVILIECKTLNTSLDGKTLLLQRYIGALPQVSLGILTDGQQYHFFTDLDTINILDTEPFLSVNLLALTPMEEKRLKLFHLDGLDVEAIKQKGRGWKVVNSLVQALEREWKDPSDDYITHFARPLHEKGLLTNSVRRQYALYLKEAHQIFSGKHIDSTTSPNYEDNDSKHSSSEIDAQTDILREQMRQIECKAPQKLHDPSRLQPSGTLSDNDPKSQERNTIHPKLESSSSYVQKVREDHPRAYARWSLVEEQKLISLYKSGLSITHIASMLERQPGGIRSRLKRVGLIPP